MKPIKAAINLTLAIVRESERNLLNEYALCSFMSKSHHDQLCLIDENRLLNSEISVIAEWLGLISSDSSLDNFDSGDEDDIDPDIDYRGGSSYLSNLNSSRAVYRSTEQLRRLDDEEFLQRMPDYDAREFEDLERRGYEEHRLEVDLKAIKNKLLVQLSARGEDGWTKQGGLRRMKKVIARQLKKGDVMGAKEARRTSDIWKLSVDNRWRLYRFWLANLRQERMEGVRGLLEQYNELYLQLKEISLERDAILLKGTRVIGMTTTGAARNRELIKIIAPRVLIVEEAAEVLESHVVTSFTQDCQHVILIGDQQQLKPNPASYDLAQQCALDISLFERLIKNKITYKMLTIQHRMRPSISKLLVPHIYRDLRDAKSVMQREEIRGMPSSVFFLNHDNQETPSKETTSIANNFEAEFVLQLYKFLLKQEYRSDQITILTTYGAQVKLIRELAVEWKMEDVMCCSVDGYQGKENDIILLSLVRSNNRSNVGFLKVANRVCVALSRARNGLFCVGNLKVLSQVKGSVWTPIVSSLARDAQIGPQLELACPNHPRVITIVRAPNDFEKLPEGGCGRPCDSRLRCKHPCPLQCHAYDREHSRIVCKRPCLKSICTLDHKCRNKCGEECSACLVVVEKVYRKCGHSNEILCHQEPEHVPCKRECKKRYPQCGHRCTGRCGHIPPCNPRGCPEKVEVESPCGHLVEMMCSLSREASLVLKSCTSACQTLLPCGHICVGTCKGCKQGIKHKACPRCKKSVPIVA